MAQKGVQMDSQVSCCICLDLLKDPVTIPCGHSYCMNCIKDLWDRKDQKGVYSCLHCKKTFTLRPALKKNTMPEQLVEDTKKTELKDAPADRCYPGHEDVTCDICTGKKMKAVKSCLVCLVSYCENHLQPHYDVAQFKKHKLVNPSKKLEEHICSRHDEVMKIFCRTDQKCICYLCLMDEHKGHETVQVAAGRAEKQKELEAKRRKVQQRIQDQEKDVKLLQQEVETINVSADKAVEDSEKIFTELIRLLQERSSEVKQQIRSQQETEVSRVKDVQEKLEQEITELKRKDAELEQLSHTEDHTQFLLNYPSLPALRESTHSSSINIRPLRHFEDVRKALSDAKRDLENLLTEIKSNISLTVSKVDVLLPEPEPKTRADFLKDSQEITLDPNTANKFLLLSDRNRKVTLMKQQQPYEDHPERFTYFCEVLSRQSLTGHSYWEVEWKGGEIEVAVTYKNISRTGTSEKCGFGLNGRSWALHCDANSYSYSYNNVKTPVSGPVSSRVGVYLNYKLGVLCFYSISKKMTLLHRVQTTFTQPLYAGLWLLDYGTTAELIRVNQSTNSKANWAF
ncbi:PREDICTED: tripartite motif-containing protein 16-like [Poecilia mexicana]|uniref:tripartite motif-containing protein 16-like n=1 Tax=Poecilia mexicana TaxID=48701 RepID=UPI00072EB491|nr:PREDICTED: tripartite motif-containing protein 16-like [Poecilia mexicana]